MFRSVYNLLIVLTPLDLRASAYFAGVDRTGFTVDKTNTSTHHPVHSSCQQKIYRDHTVKLSFNGH